MKLCPGHERLSSDYADWKCGSNCPFCGGVCSKCFPPEPATPTPSITVGTQVRLTGVVRDHNNTVAAVAIGGMAGNDNIIWVMHDQLEVIRQPFKRGEVVWPANSQPDEVPLVVLNDERDGKVDVTDCKTGETFTDDNASAFERRP